MSESKPDNVVSLVTRRPHLSGTGVCVNCRHEWEAVAPVGSTELECPNCGTFKGVFKWFVYPEEYWVCNCGSWVLIKSKSGFMCAGCGIQHEE